MKLLTSLLLLLAFAALARGSYVTDALAQMPAQNSADESVLAAKILGGGAPAIKELCGMLVPLGTEGKDDTNVRDAISGLVRHVGRHGGEANRALLTKGLCDALAGDVDPEVKSFLICRLQDIGHDDAVPTLAPLLADEKLALYASAALERIATPAATEALVKALPQASGPRRVAIIKSLGTLRAADAAGEIRKAAADDDKTVRMTALWALANIGDASARELASKTLDNTKSSYDRSRLYSYVILSLRRQFEGGAKQPAAEACIALLNAPASAAAPTNTRIAAARLLAEIQGQDAVATLMPLAEKGDYQFRAGALDAIAHTPGNEVTAALVGRLKANPAAEVKVDLLRAMGKRKDAAARPAVIEATKDADAAVGAAAIGALVSLGRDDAIAPLVGSIASQGADAKLAAETLARIPGDKPLAAAGAALASANAKAKITLIELLAARGATSQKDAVLKQAAAADADESVRQAALKAMEKVGTEEDAGKLIDLAIGTQSDTTASAALKAAAACAARNADASARSAPFVAALANAKGPRRAAIERALARIGGEKALQVVVADLKSNDKPTREGALNALAEWQDAAAIPALLEAAASNDTDDQVTAIRGVVRILRSAADMPQADKAAAYRKALAAAKRPQEKKMLLGAMAGEHGEEIFELAASMLDVDGLKPEASLAVIKIAIPQPRGHQGLQGAKVADALEKAIEHCPDGGLKADAERYVRKMKK